MGNNRIHNQFEHYEPEPNSGCWLWKGCISVKGYGQLGKIFKNSRFAHRAYFIYYKGEISENLYVLHKCDNRACVNPDHLFLGTYKDNMQDMLQKGRGNFVKSDEHKRKLSEIGKTKTGELNNHFGFKHSEESKLKNRLSQLGKKQSEETKLKRSESLLKYHALRRTSREAITL